jgi:hypothetical protein
MLLRLFKGTTPGVIFLIIITLLAVWFATFLKHPIDSVFHYITEPMPLYGLLKNIVGDNHFLGVIFSLSLVSLIAFLLVNFNSNGLFINERTFIPALIYILLSGLFPEYQVLNPVIPASLFLILAIIRIMDGYRIPGIAYNFFDAGIMISTGSLFYANLIWFGLLLIIGIAILRTGNFREIALSILGLLTPYLFTFGFFYVIGKDLAGFLSLMKDNLFSRSEGYPFSSLTVVVLIFTGLTILVSLAYLLRVMNSKKIKSRKTFSLLIWTFIISMVIYFALPSVSVEIVWLTAIPVSYFLSHYFIFDKTRMVPGILFSVLFVLILIIQIRSLK